MTFWPNFYIYIPNSYAHSLYSVWPQNCHYFLALNWAFGQWKMTDVMWEVSINPYFFHCLFKIGAFIEIDNILNHCNQLPLPFFLLCRIVISQSWSRRGSWRILNLKAVILNFKLKIERITSRSLSRKLTFNLLPTVFFIH